MACNKVPQYVRPTANLSSGTALLAAALASLAGTTIALGQTQPLAPVPPSAITQPTTGTPKNTQTETPAASDTKADTKPDTTKSDAKPTDGSDKVHVDGNQIVDLHVNDEDLANVLEMLSIQSQKNIVASKSVSARVTANLYGVTFKEALDAILNVNGFGYVEDGNFIFVYTLDELKKIEASQRVKVTKVVQLNYLNAVDAAEFVKPLLSEGAQIKTNGKTATFPTAGQVPIGGDDFANSATMVITDYEDHIGEIEALLRQLDTRPAQVLVEATVMQTTLTEDNAFGIDFSLIADMNFGDFVGVGGPTQAVNALIGGRDAPGSTNPFPADGNGGAISSTVGNTSSNGGLKAGIVTGDVAVFMRVLDEVTDTTILSNPKVLALNRMPAHVLVGRKVGYLSTTSTDTATTQTVEFLDTGTQLYFRPFVTNEGLVRMELKPQISEAIIRQANDASGKTVTIPDEDTNELTTNVIVHDGQTIVLGGLFRESTTTTRRQVPLLGDIPIVGLAFRGNEDETVRNEIIFLVTPSIVNDQTLASQGERGKEYVDHLRVGSREGVLFFSRDKLSNRRNLKAQRAFESGDTESALWNVQRSLTLNPAQPEVIAMREKLTGENNLYPTRSYLERVLHGDAEQMLKKGQSRADSPMLPTQTTEVPDTTVTTNFNRSVSNTSPSYNTFEDPNTPDSATTPTPGQNPTPTTTPAQTPGNNANPADGAADNKPANPGDNNGTDELRGNNPGDKPADSTEPSNNGDFSNNGMSETTPTDPTQTGGNGQSDNSGQTNPAGSNEQANGQGGNAPAGTSTGQNSTKVAGPNAGKTANAAVNGQKPPMAYTAGPVGHVASKTTSGATPNSNTAGTSGNSWQNNSGSNQFAQNTTPTSDEASGQTTPGDWQNSGNAGGNAGEGWNNGEVTSPAPTAQATTNGQTVAAANTEAGTAAARLWCGRHSFMQGMWSFFKFTAGKTSTVTQAPESTTPESTDNR
jgi:type IV pilus secretin PilQ/predicted competence protein